MVVEEGDIGGIVAEEVVVQRERDGQIGAGPDGKVQIGQRGQRRAPRVHDDQHGAIPLCFAHEGHEVNAGRGGVGAPNDDQLAVGVVRRCDARHLAVEGLRRGAGRRRADGPGEPGRAEPAEERRVARILRQQAVGAAVGERQDGLAAPAIANLRQPRCDLIQRFVPIDFFELAATLRSLPDGWTQQTVVAVETPVEPPHLAADVAVGDFLHRRAVDRNDLSLLDGHRQAAGVWAIEGTRRVDRPMSPALVDPRCRHSDQSITRASR